MRADLSGAVLMCSASVADRVGHALGIRPVSLEHAREAQASTWVVVGGGTLLDQAKWARREAPELRLIAVPSIWGSGAEASPVVVVDDAGRKEIHLDDGLVPDVRVVWPALAETIAPSRARAAAGDVWAHALEAFLSPLATAELRGQLADVVKTLLTLEPVNDAAWFDPSAEASALQARAGVGLVHGLAHALEAPARAELPVVGLGHAELCATFLWPVMSFNRDQGSCVWRTRCEEFQLAGERVLERCAQLFDEALYEQLLPLVEAHWSRILRDPCTRTNSTLVRRGSLAYFKGRGFQ